MDFWTAMAYWGILVLIILNTILVSRMEIKVDDDESCDS
jgi:hypothetical protein